MAWRLSDSTTGRWTRREVKKSSRLVGIVFLVIGVFLLYFGFQSTQSVLGELTELTTGRYSDETMLHLVGGAVCAVIGLFLVLKN